MSTSSGKTRFIDNLLKEPETLLEEKPDGILLFYERFQLIYTRWHEMYHDNFLAIRGLDDAILSKLDKTKRYICIIDDLQSAASREPLAYSLLTSGRHLGLIGVFLLNHSCFSKGQYGAAMNATCSALILFRGGRICAQIPIIARHYGVKKLLSAYNLATKNKPFSYLLVDQTHIDSVNDIYEHVTLRSAIFENDLGPMTCYF